MNQNIIAVLLIIGAVVVSGFLIFSGSNDSTSQIQNNLSTVDGKQIITINAKGGYYPKITNAKANTPTVLRMITDGTFDCSSSLVIRDIGYTQNLPSTGQTDIEVPLNKTTGTLQGLCSMGMYGFQIKFN